MTDESKDENGIVRQAEQASDEARQAAEHAAEAARLSQAVSATLHDRGDDDAGADERAEDASSPDLGTDLPGNGHGDTADAGAPLGGTDISGGGYGPGPGGR